MIHFTRILIGLTVLAVLVFVCLVVYTLTVKFGIFFFMAIGVICVAYWIGNELFDI